MRRGVHAIGRREFVRQLGGVVVLVSARPAAATPGDELASMQRLYPQDINAYVAVGRDGRIKVFSGKIEMGQGVITSQAQLVAEELGVDMTAIDMVLGDTDQCPWDMGTFGSLTTRVFGPVLRAAAARARDSLLAVAAQRLGASLEQLRIESGVVSVKGEPARAIGYGDLSRGARLVDVVHPQAVPHTAREFRVMGRSPARLDGVDKVTGAALYAADIRRPGMLYARVLRPPVHGAVLKHVDMAAAKALDGVVVVQDGDLVAVLHPHPQGAAQALERIEADWARPPAPDRGRPVLDENTIFDHLEKAPADQRVSVDTHGVPRARHAAAQVLERSYRKGYVAHAALEPHAALAEWSEGKLTVWASTQTPFPTRDRIAQVLGLPVRGVRVITPYLGGGFGGKSASEQAVEAARLARLCGRPVQVARTREEEFFLDTFDPACVVTIASGLDPHGRVNFWDSVVYAAGERGSALIYDVPQMRTRLVGRTSFAESADPLRRVHPFAVGPWRAPGATMNVFAIESQMDAMARAAGADPVGFRRDHLSDTRMQRTLDTAAKAFGWTPAPHARRGVGVACSVDAGTCVAAMAQIEVERASGRLHVRRLVCAQDMGLVVNPEGARMQMEGALTMGLGYTLSEELRFRDGDILDRNFDTYDIPRFGQVPRLETLLVPHDEWPPQGGGEPAVTVVGAVVANAFFDATGVQPTRLPLTPARVRELLG